MQDMSSEKFPAIPRKPTHLMNGWNGLINHNGRAGSDAVLKDVFAAPEQGREEPASTEDQASSEVPSE
jgi:hypothetical protein